MKRINKARRLEELRRRGIDLERLGKIVARKGALPFLSDVEREIFDRYYGFDGHHCHTIEQIAILDPKSRTREQIRKMRENVVMLIRDHFGTPVLRADAALEASFLDFFTYSRGASVGVSRRVMTRIRNKLRDVSILNVEGMAYVSIPTTMRLLVTLSRWELLRQPCLGRDSVDAVEKILATAGLQLRQTDDPTDHVRRLFE